ncbi:MAG: hypothetical protein R6U63_15345 [Longimicrobiales bacterium]
MTAVLMVALVGCGDRDSQMDFSGDDVGPDVHVIHSHDGNLKMGLTEDWVYFALSDSTRAEAQAELAADAEADGLKGFFGGLMRRVVGKALNFRASYAVSEIRDIRWQDGRMHVEFDDPERQLAENLQFGEDESVVDAFAREEVESFAEAFRAMKDEGGAQR